MIKDAVLNRVPIQGLPKAIFKVTHNGTHPMSPIVDRFIMSRRKKKPIVIDVSFLSTHDTLVYPATINMIRLAIEKMAVFLLFSLRLCCRYWRYFRWLFSLAAAFSSGTFDALSIVHCIIIHLILDQNHVRLYSPHCFLRGREVRNRRLPGYRVLEQTFSLASS